MYIMFSEIICREKAIRGGNGLFNLLKKENKIVKAPMECRIGDFLKIERRLVGEIID